MEIKVLGIRIDIMSSGEAITRIASWIDGRERGKYATLTNVHMVVEARRSEEFRGVLRDASLCLPDGMPLVWMARAQGIEASRVSGPDFMIDFCEKTGNKGYRHYFYGGAPTVPKELAQCFQQRFPSLKVAGWYSPPFRELTSDESTDVVKKINDTNPDIIWVGLGCPKQERWMRANCERLNAPVMLGVGQAFDVHTGHLPRAPKWMCEHGLEWLFRLCVEPRRLWRRYLVTNTSFLTALFLETLGLKRFE